MKSHEEVKRYHESISQEVNTFIREYNDHMVNGREKHGIPLYATKCRAKTIDSIYLKLSEKIVGFLILQIMVVCVCYVYLSKICQVFLVILLNI